MGGRLWLSVKLLPRWLIHLPVAVTFATMVALVLGAGAALGLPELLWHEHLPTQAAAGAALMGLCAELAVIVGLLARSNGPLLVHLHAPGLLLLLLMLPGRRPDSAAAGWPAFVAAAVVL